MLTKQIAELDDWVTGKRSHLFSAFIKQFNYLRKFSPAFLEYLEFEDSRGTDTPLICATELLKEMNAEKKRKVPEDAPTEFVSKTIRPLVVSDGAIDKHAWECALIKKIRDEIKSGNIYVKNSKRFGAFDRFFISDTKWSSLREDFFKQSGLPSKGCDAAAYLSERLNLAYDRFLETLPNNTYAQVDGASWHCGAIARRKTSEAPVVGRSGSSLQRNAFRYQSIVPNLLTQQRKPKSTNSRVF